MSLILLLFILRGWGGQIGMRTMHNFGPYMSQAPSMRIKKKKFRFHIFSSSSFPSSPGSGLLESLHLFCAWMDTFCMLDLSRASTSESFRDSGVAFFLPGTETVREQICRGWAPDLMLGCHGTWFSRSSWLGGVLVWRCRYEAPGNMPQAGHDYHEKRK